MSTEIYVDAFDADYAGMHKSDMEHDIPELLKLMMERMGGGQVELARRLGLKNGQPRVSKWLTGSKPTADNYVRIILLATGLGILSDVRSEDVAESIDRGPKREIPVRGYVGANSQSFPFNTSNPGDFGSIEASDQDTDQTVALVIIGTSLGEFFNRWYVLYDDVRSPITDNLIGPSGPLCVVGLSDDRVLLKKIERGSKRGFYNLLSNAKDEPAIENVSIEWAAKVKNLRPG